MLPSGAFWGNLFGCQSLACVVAFLVMAVRVVPLPPPPNATFTVAFSTAAGTAELYPSLFTFITYTYCNAAGMSNLKFTAFPFSTVAVASSVGLLSVLYGFAVYTLMVYVSPVFSSIDTEALHTALVSHVWSGSMSFTGKASLAFS